MARKYRKTNRQLLEGLVDNISGLKGKVQHIDERVDGVHTRTDSLHERFDDLRDHIDNQFDNHLSEHATLNKRLFKGGLVLVGLIVVAVGFNNVETIIKLVTAALRWI